MVTYDPIKHIISFDEEPKRSGFRLDKIELLVCNNQMVDIDLSRQKVSLFDDSFCQFSLLIGVNGVGKTTDGYIVAEKNGQLLVCSLKEEQKIKEFGQA